MDYIQGIILALVQGITEFLPISSSGHLILFPALMGWPDQGLAFDVAVHVGSLAAVMLYFRQEIATMLVAWIGSVSGHGNNAESRLAWAVLWGTIPVGLVGILFKDFIEESLRSPLVIAATTVLFGLLLWWADRQGKRQRDEYSMGWGDIAFIGCTQALALIPGTSRSGVTMTAALMLGMTRQAAARYSFLLSIPVILLSGLVKTKDLVESTVAVDWGVIAVGTLTAAVSAYLCIHLFLTLLDRIGMLPFVIYRLALGALLFVVFW